LHSVDLGPKKDNNLSKTTYGVMKGVNKGASIYLDKKNKNLGINYHPEG